MDLKQKAGDYSLITTLFMILLTIGLVSSVAINIYQDREQERKIMYMWRDYMPAIFMEGLMKTYSLQTEALLAEINDDPEKTKIVNVKFDDLRKELLNNLQEMRGGMTSITRSVSDGFGGASE
jgi:hypothetical protein